MRRFQIAILVAVITAAGCTAGGAAPAAIASLSTAIAPIPTTTPSVPVAPTKPPAQARPTAGPAEPIPDALIGAWSHPSGAFWWLLRAGSPTCVTVARTDLDCVAYQLVGQPAYVGAATMDGRVLRIRWVRGYCAGDRTSFGTGIDDDTLKLFDMPDDCGGADFVLSRAGVGAAPSAPPPPTS
ncbi:MAG TPA: hypothetical protein VL749_04230 [Patescibacteria group bacterium]|nr:hypothetical protein [Patescibacteria group bacterium]